MKTTAAVIVAFIFSIVAWMLLSLLLFSLAYVAARARPGGLELLHIGNLLMMWLLGPAFGGFVATFVTPKLFKTVEPGTIVAGFIAIVATLGVAFGAMKLSLVLMQKKELADAILFGGQIASMIGGALVGRASARI